MPLSFSKKLILRLSRPDAGADPVADAAAEAGPGAPPVESSFAWHVLRVVVSTVLFVAASLCVLGGILEGHSALFGDQRIAALATLAVLLFVLGLFEGLQICVALLRLKDVEYFEEHFGRARELHRLFRSEAGTRRFLAGRQFFVVFVVFFIARITAFPGLRHVPLLGLRLPAELDVLWYGLFDLGLMGAFLVLWVAQLAPQFSANRDPLRFLELPGMGPALRSSFVVDDVGITLPGFWLSSWIPERRRKRTWLRRVVSGGQTGVDRAALHAARDAGLEIGGWCPPGRAAEDGAIPDGLPLEETPEERSPHAPDVSRSQRTEWNVRDADATLILRPENLRLEGRGEKDEDEDAADDPGTEWTALAALHHGRPVFACDPGEEGAAERIVEWLRSLRVETLNVAGPAESAAPGIGEAAGRLLGRVLPAARAPRPPMDPGIRRS